MKDLVGARRLSYDVVEQREAPRVDRSPRKARPKPRAQKSEPRAQKSEPARRVNPTLSAAAIAEAVNALEAAHASGDYRQQSVADLIRAALRARATGLRLTQQARSGRRKRHTVELPRDLFVQYQELPTRSRGVIIERALLSFLAEGFRD